MKQTILSFFLMILPFIAWADDNGSCGDGVTYTYVESTHTLTISKTGNGTGEMSNYYDSSYYPWSSFAAEILNIIIEDGVTSIGDYAFLSFSNLISVKISDGMISIGNSAFWGCPCMTSVIIPESVTSIGNSAFSSCSGLMSVNIPRKCNLHWQFCFF